MQSTSQARHGNLLTRQLAHLKLISRLLAHELHSQGGAKTITLTRDEVTEIQASLDLFIEEAGRRQGPSQFAVSPDSTTLVSARTT